jgi:hypothetical protein
MADESNTSPDLPDSASDISEVVKIQSEAETKLAEALKPWTEDCSSLSGALKPIEEALRTLTTARSREWAKHGEVIQKGTQGVIEWVARFAALVTDFSDLGPRLRGALNRADHVGRLGWTMTGNMMPSDMFSLSSMQLPAEADAYMLAWYDELDVDLEGLEGRLLGVTELEPFHTPISQCFTAYRRGDYAIAIPFLAALLERGIRHLGPTERFFSTNMTKTVKDRYESAKQDHRRTVRASFWMSLYSCVQWFYEQYGPTASGEDRIFRHGIQHGTQPPPNEKVEVLRLLHAQNTITGLYPK